MRAIFALQYFINSREGISAARLVPEVAEGRDAIRTALKELRDAGLITTRKERVGKDIKTVSFVTEAGFVEAGLWGLTIPPLLQQSLQNSNISNIYAYSANKTTIEKRLDKKMGYEFFESTSDDSSEREAEREKAALERRKAYQERKSQEHAKSVADKANREPKRWIINQCVAQFKERVDELWSIPPWKMANSTFHIAFADARRKYDTNGEIELEMMNIFFTQLKVNKETDGDKLWKMFIYRYSELATLAKLRISSPEKQETAMADAEAQWKKEFGEDFNV